MTQRKKIWQESSASDEAYVMERALMDNRETSLGAAPPVNATLDMVKRILAVAALLAQSTQAAETASAAEVKNQPENQQFDDLRYGDGTS